MHKFTLDTSAEDATTCQYNFYFLTTFILDDNSNYEYIFQHSTIGYNAIESDFNNAAGSRNIPQTYHSYSRVLSPL
jgi:hypothetical protein